MAPTSRPREPRREDAAPTVAGIRISHADRLVYPDPGLTKLVVARYYEAIGDWIVPHVAGRPLTLVHCPQGLAADCRYLRHTRAWGPTALRRVKIQEKTKVGEYLVADSVAAVVALAQMGVLEIHTWNSRIERVERPDRIVWDLDPGRGVAWREVIAAARTVSSVLEVLGLECWVKTTGGLGLHVVMPIDPTREWADCLQFSRAVAQALVRSEPTRYTTTYAKQSRDRLILIDYLRNNRTNTTIAAYSTRARTNAPVSMPVTWSELTPRLDPSRFSVLTAAQRVAKLRRDPWEGYWKKKQRLTDEALEAVTRV